MKLLPPAVAGLAIFNLSLPAAAQVYDLEQLAKVDAVHIVVLDQVKDGCLPAPDVLENEASSVLRQFGIVVSNTLRDGDYLLEIIPTAGSVTNFPFSCFGNVHIKLTRAEALADRTVGLVISAHDGRVGLAAKPVFQDRFQSAVNIMITALANEIHKAHSL